MNLNLGQYLTNVRNYLVLRYYVFAAKANAGFSPALSVPVD